MVVPPFSALFADPPFQVASNQRPPLWTVLVHKFNHFVILLQQGEEEGIGREAISVCVWGKEREREREWGVCGGGGDISREPRTKSWP
jgi:hypothetical protein